MTIADIRRRPGLPWARYVTKLCLLLSCVTLAGAAACSSREAPRADDENLERVTGSVQVPLVTPLGDRYRLRGAVFEITRASRSVVTLDSESDPDATSLRTELDSGAYQITLLDGWSLDRLGDAGGPVTAALLTPNPLAFEIENARVTDLAYSFTTPSGIVTFGSGDLSVSVDVASSAPSTSCNLLDRSSCPAGLTCLFSGDSGRTYCAAPGSLAAGSPCSSEQCVAGAQCVAVDPTQPDVRTCARFCNPDRSGCGCRALAFDDAVGVCAGGNVDSTFGFTADRCSIVGHGGVTGDDRGGIAVSDQHVFYTGDSQTGRFDLGDLGNAASLPRRFDGIVSDLDSGALYSLSVDGTPLDSSSVPCSAGIRFGSLLELSPSDGAVLGTIPLSEGIPYDCGAGIFAGSGFILITDDSAVFLIDPDGTVTNLGSRPPIPTNGCESWAFWGVAERVGDDYRLLTVASSQIMRTHLDGTSEVAASFSSLGDMCSFSVSKSQARWYFHYESGAQFGGFDENIGFCAALIE